MSVSRIDLVENEFIKMSDLKDDCYRLFKKFPQGHMKSLKFSVINNNNSTRIDNINFIMGRHLDKYPDIYKTMCFIKHNNTKTIIQDPKQYIDYGPFFIPKRKNIIDMIMIPEIERQAAPLTIITILKYFFEDAPQTEEEYVRDQTIRFRSLLLPKTMNDDHYLNDVPMDTFKDIFSFVIA